VKKEFQGNPKRINPALIIDPNHPNRFDEFFLVLGTIYNDLKDLIFFLICIEENFRKPLPGETNAHAGEYSGVTRHVDKLVCATIYEFFNFLKEYSDVISDVKFLLILKNLDGDRKREWSILINIAQGRKIDTTKFGRILQMVRDNISSHYYQSGKVLAKSYIDYFFKDKKEDFNQYAYFSLGGKMATTRFYYSDAALESYYKNIMSNTSGYSLKQCVDDVNQVIYALLESYLIKIKKIQ
jgi:hypothetical protein